MIPWWVLALLVLGVNVTVWGLLGVCRLIDGQLTPRLRARPSKERTPDMRCRPRLDEVAVLIAAHNEEVVIHDSLTAIMALVPSRNVHVVSDASTDRTFEIAEQAGATVISTHTNVGKAGALHEAFARLQLAERFRVVLLLDADTHVQPGYFDAALPLFDDPHVVAVAGCVRTANTRSLSLLGEVLVAHRHRIYAVGQHVLKFGQTWSRTNATHIIPGFASMYRTTVLGDLEVNPPGLVIEDFNMTFEVYLKGLGKVGFTPKAVAVTQDPDNLPDYIRQTRRWSLGLWQTVRRHRPRWNLFTAMVGVLLAELVSSTLVFLLIPFILLVLLLPTLFGAGPLGWPVFGPIHTVVAAHMNTGAIFYGVLLPDYAMTCFVALLGRRPAMLFCGLFFPLMRLIDAVITLSTVPQAWFAKSDGRWRSPARQAIPAGSSLPAAVAPSVRRNASPSPPSAGGQDIVVSEQ
jgi:cellulose synthase/poly-beta-1,6-N-acetylglucosamine synthase-like glycosyltransferase